ncbi:MAG: glycosyltransferase [Flavobacteriales bacterium]|nr:MAG: glycosyltransferase [Flavobacteriales bacterium]|tara:strand:+ start:1506 stop:2216 length:711 start_codon:yes stop_codon:yes gene_type:complete
MVKFTIVVPVFNEKDNLSRLEVELMKFINSTKYKTKILIIDDGSTDGSKEIIKRLCEKNSFFEYVSFKTNHGLSSALKAGFDLCDSEYLGYIDADLQTSPNDFHNLLKYIGKYDLVTGYRAKRKDSLIKKLTSLAANNIRNLFTNDGVNDTGCPLKVIKTDYAKRIPMFKGLHRFLPAMILLQKGKIIEIPVQHFPRIAGKAKFGLFNRILGPLSDCFAFIWMRRKYINYQIDNND